MKMAKFLFAFFLFSALCSAAYCQQKDTAVIIGNSIKYHPAKIDSTAKIDSLAKKKHDPTRATLYAAIFPGAGQVYNKKYWKLPLVYAAVGIPAYTFFYNRSWYTKTRYALGVVANGESTNAAAVSKIDPQIQQYIFLDGTLRYDSATTISALIIARDGYRKNEDYSVLFFLLFYALQIVDATVDAHLKDFNVNSDLSFRIRPNAAPGPGGNGLSLVFDIHKPRQRELFNVK
jgi:uncharacterized protein DUF5683